MKIFPDEDTRKLSITDNLRLIGVGAAIIGTIITIGMTLGAMAYVYLLLAAVGGGIAWVLGVLAWIGVNSWREYRAKR